MRVAVPLRLAETHAINDARVVQRIRDDGVLLIQQRLKNAGVRIEAARVQDGILGSKEVRHGLLQLLVDVGGAADETHRRQPVAVCVQRIFCCLNDLWVPGKAKVVVGTEVQQGLGRGLDVDRGALLGRDDTL
ncbi:hypothetical protein DQ04_19521000 [Trypanosoma grayi]|uniref:hypothetical protein n=1 Tax=Trypanosoma grayi TaxID=71804 RepID=UPI0004F3FCE3|nr:hypothetical protein DQ04_19521000 [Trypanosoma grayi]KEG05665.1 hypothetical protein DQ04_19521000 [Trypanosoma grayi]